MSSDCPVRSLLARHGSGHLEDGWGDCRARFPILTNLNSSSWWLLYGQCRSRRITDHNPLGAGQGLTNGSVQPGQGWAEDVGARESPLGPAPTCILCVNLSWLWNGTEPQLPALYSGDNHGTPARGAGIMARPGPSAWHREGLGEGGAGWGWGALFQPIKGRGLPEATQQKLPQDPSAPRLPPHQSTTR